MQYEVLQQTKYVFSGPLDLNRANICFVNPRSLGTIQMGSFGYRQLKSKYGEHTVMIFPDETVPQMILGIPIELKATLRLERQERIKVSRVAVKMDVDKFYGLPTFRVAGRVQFIGIVNEVLDLMEQSILPQIIKQAFYFRPGQQFMIRLDRVQTKALTELSVQKRKKWKRQVNVKSSVRLFVEGVRYIENKIQRYEIWDGTSSYFIFDPTTTTIGFQKSRFLNRPNITHPVLAPVLCRIYQLKPYLTLKSCFFKAVESNNPTVILEKRSHFGIRDYLKFVAQQNQAHFYYMDCQMQFNVKSIDSFVSECYSKSPALIYLDNIEWIYSLLSGNLDPKTNSFKFVEKLTSTFKRNLMKKGNKYPLILILSYTKNLFQIHNIEGIQSKFMVDKQDIQQMNAMVLNQYPSRFDEAELTQIVDISKSVGWQLLSSILEKKPLFRDVIKSIQNTVKTEKVAQIPKVNWDDIGGLDVAKDEIIQTIMFPKLYPEIFDSLIRPRSGLLFYGPPGTGKTLLAKCIANECKMNFISVKGPEMLNMYIGESQKNVRETFERAFESKPCIIFFDELDALIPKRGNSNDSGQVMDRIVAQLLSQMDNAWRVGDIFVIGATNRPDLLDPSIMRPGRFDKQIYLGICYQRQQRINILKAQTKKLKLSENVDFGKVVDQLPRNFTGADFYGLTSKALTIAINKLVSQIQSTFDPSLTDWDSHMKTYETQGVTILQQDLIQALKGIKPSVSLEQLEKFQQLKSKYS